MAIIKILHSTEQSGSDALDYVICKHDETTRDPILDEDGRREIREEYYLTGINCSAMAFPTEMTQLEAVWGKNLEPDDIRLYQIIISYNPKDTKAYILDGSRAQLLSLTLVERCLPGTLGIACTHLDGDHQAGNIHTHIFLSSIQYTDEIATGMHYPVATSMGEKLDFSVSTKNELKKHLAQIVEEAELHPDNLFQISGDRISNGEYWARYRGQQRLDEENRKRMEAGLPIEEFRFRGEKDLLREALRDAMFQSTSLEQFHDQLETQYQVKAQENGRFWRYGFLGSDHNYAASTLGANYLIEEITRILEDNRRHPERMEEYLAEKMHALEAEKVLPELDPETISGCRRIFAEPVQDNILASAIQKLALPMEQDEEAEALLPKWTPLAKSVIFVSEHHIYSLQQFDPAEIVMKTDAAFFHKHLLESNAELRNRINILHYAKIMEQYNDKINGNHGDAHEVLERYFLQEVADARTYFQNIGITLPVSVQKTWEEKMAAQKIADHYQALLTAKTQELESLNEVRGFLEPWKEQLPMESVVQPVFIEMLTPRDLHLQTNRLQGYLDQENLPAAVGFGITPPDYVFWDDNVHHSREEEIINISPEASNQNSESGNALTSMREESDRIPAVREFSTPEEAEESETESILKGEETSAEENTLEEERNARIRKLMERRRADRSYGDTAERTGGERSAHTNAVIERAEAGIHLADAIEQNSGAERDHKIAQRADRDAQRERRATEERRKEIQSSNVHRRSRKGIDFER